MVKRLLAGLLFAQLIIRDEGVRLSPPQVDAKEVNCTGSGVQCTYSKGVWTLSVDGGSGSGSGITASSCSAGQYAFGIDAGGDLFCSTPAGVPGGNTTEVQYNNAGAFGGMSGVFNNSGNLELDPETSHPSFPANSLFYSYRANSAVPPVQFLIGTSKIGFPVQVGALAPFQNLNSKVECTFPNNWNTQTLFQYNSGDWQSVGTNASVAWDAGQPLTRYQHSMRSTATSANVTAGIYRSAGTQASAWMGGSGEGGFLFWARVGFGIAKAGQRVGIGMAGILNTAPALLPSSNNDPNTRLNTAYIGCNGGEATLSACSNDGSGNATCHTTLSASFPCDTSGALYDVWIWTNATNTAIDWYVQRLDSAATASGSMTSDLPVYALLGANALVNTGNSAGTATAIRFYGMCTVALY
jgi:hypothetical protein